MSHDSGNETTLSDVDATMIAEGIMDADEAIRIQAWQHLIDTGLAWRLQGWFGRTADNLIAHGICQQRDRSR